MESTPEYVSRTTAFVSTSRGKDLIQSICRTFTENPEIDYECSSRYRVDAMYKGVSFRVIVYNDGDGESIVAFEREYGDRVLFLEMYRSALLSLGNHFTRRASVGAKGTTECLHTVLPPRLEGWNNLPTLPELDSFEVRTTEQTESLTHLLSVVVNTIYIDVRQECIATLARLAASDNQNEAWYTPTGMAALGIGLTSNPRSGLDDATTILLHICQVSQFHQVILDSLFDKMFDVVRAPDHLATRASKRRLLAVFAVLAHCPRFHVLFVEKLACPCTDNRVRSG